jgi:hypothetical protein
MRVTPYGPYNSFADALCGGHEATLTLTSLPTLTLTSLPMFAFKQKQAPIHHRLRDYDIMRHAKLPIHTHAQAW